jgi:hypothetical protein
MAIIPTTWEIEAGEFKVQDQPGQQQNPISKEKNQKTKSLNILEIQFLQSWNI